MTKPVPTSRMRPPTGSIVRHERSAAARGLPAAALAGRLLPGSGGACSASASAIDAQLADRGPSAKRVVPAVTMSSGSISWKAPPASSVRPLRVRSAPPAPASSILPGLIDSFAWPGFKLTSSSLMSSSSPEPSV